MKIKFKRNNRNHAYSLSYHNYRVADFSSDFNYNVNWG